MPGKVTDVYVKSARTAFIPPAITEEQLSEVAKCAASPEHFLDTYAFILDPVKGKIRFNLFEYQHQTLKAFIGHLSNIILKSRQMGLSWLVSGFVLWMAMFYTDKNILIISMKDAIAKRLLDRVKYIFDNLPDWLKMQVAEDTRSVFGLANGSRVESIPTSEEAGRSEGVSLLIIDEAAFVRWIDQIWTAAEPTLSMGGAVVLLSSPNGVGNFFHQQWVGAQTSSNGFNPVFLPWWKNPMYSKGLIKKKFRLPSGRVVERYWSPWYESRVKKLGTRRASQEIDCDFLTSGSNLFDVELLQQRYEFVLSHAKYVEKWNGELRIFESPKPNCHYVIGIDTATGHGEDYSCGVIREFSTWNQVATFKTQIPISELVYRVYELGERYNYAYVVGEETGVSLAILLQLRDHLNYPEDKLYHDTVVEDRFHEPSERLGWSNNVKSRTVFLRRYDEVIRKQIKTFKDPRQVAELLTFVVNKNGKPEALQGYNDDFVFADLCAYIGLTNYQPFGGLPFVVR